MPSVESYSTLPGSTNATTDCVPAHECSCSQYSLKFIKFSHATMYYFPSDLFHPPQNGESFCRKVLRKQIGVIYAFSLWFAVCPWLRGKQAVSLAYIALCTWPTNSMLSLLNALLSKSLSQLLLISHTLQSSNEGRKGMEKQNSLEKGYRHSYCSPVALWEGWTISNLSSGPIMDCGTQAPEGKLNTPSFIKRNWEKTWAVEKTREQWLGNKDGHGCNALFLQQGYRREKKKCWAKLVEAWAKNS